jgi:hypothetical protein
MKAFLCVLAVAAATGCGSTPTRARAKHPTQLGNGIVNGFQSDPAIRAQEAVREFSRREEESLRQQQEIDRQDQELQRQQQSTTPLDRPDMGGTCLSCPDGR